MRLASWSVQWCRGVDDRVDPARIAREAKRLADPDVVRLQEVAQGFAASLPWPADPGIPRMPRAALEVSVDAPFGALRIVSTHLEYYSSVQRADLRSPAARRRAQVPSGLAEI
jgi:endonuclease/exonuclease/phosphatase family metal-dependent hydrolase